MALRTLTALYNDPATAESAMERLRAIGVPERSLEMHRAAEGDIPPGNAPSGGLFALADPLGTAGDPHGLGGAGTVVMALHVPEELVVEAASILHERAIEVDNERDRG